MVVVAAAVIFFLLPKEEETPEVVVQEPAAVLPSFELHGHICKRGFEATKKTRSQLYNFDAFGLVTLEDPSSCQSLCQAEPGCSFYQEDENECIYVTNWDYGAEKVLFTVDTASDNNPSKCYIRII